MGKLLKAPWSVVKISEDQLVGSQQDLCTCRTVVLSAACPFPVNRITPGSTVQTYRQVAGVKLHWHRVFSVSTDPELTFEAHTHGSWARPQQVTFIFITFMGEGI